MERRLPFRQELIQSYVQDQAGSGLCSSFLWTVYPAISRCALSWALASHHAEISLPLRKLGRREEARKHLDNALATPPGEVTQVPATGPSIRALFSA
jgi:hypothetical protein